MTEMPPLVALVGNPNAGKSALFNALTGARQKIANYPGVTVERKSGRAPCADGRPVEMIDLPGAYSLSPDSLDEAVTRDVEYAQQRLRLQTEPWPWHAEAQTSPLVWGSFAAWFCVEASPPNFSRDARLASSPGFSPCSTPGLLQ